MTGAELRAARKAKGMTQIRLAELAGCHREAVRYWEAKPIVATRWGMPARFCEILELPVYWPSRQTPERRLYGVLLTEKYQALLDAELLRLAEAEKARAARRRLRCGAKTRKGSPCRCKSEPGKRRCKFHGGKSTGPRTPEGKARIAEAQRERWRKFRASKP